MGMRKRNRDDENEFPSGRCEACDGEVELDLDIERGDIVSCNECGAEYAIKALQPVRLQLLVEEREDDHDDE